MNKTITLFLSYSRADADIADQIDSRLHCKKGLDGEIIKIMRDVRDVGPYEIIVPFLEKIRFCDYSIFIISDEYLKSYYCLYEVIEFLKKENYETSAFPIILDSANNIRGLDGQTYYIDFWNDEYKKAISILAGFDPDDTIEQTRRKQRIRFIKQEIGSFIDFINKINTVSFDILKNSKFKQITDYIGIKQTYHDMFQTIETMYIDGKEPKDYNDFRNIFIESFGNNIDFHNLTEEDNMLLVLGCQYFYNIDSCHEILKNNVTLDIIKDRAKKLFRESEDFKRLMIRGCFSRIYYPEFRTQDLNFMLSNNWFELTDFDNTSTYTKFKDNISPHDNLIITSVTTQSNDIMRIIPIQYSTMTVVLTNPLINSLSMCNLDGEYALASELLPDQFIKDKNSGRVMGFIDHIRRSVRILLTIKNLLNPTNIDKQITIGFYKERYPNLTINIAVNSRQVLFYPNILNYVNNKYSCPFIARCNDPIHKDDYDRFIDKLIAAVMNYISKNTDSFVLTNDRYHQLEDNVLSQIAEIIRGDHVISAQYAEKKNEVINRVAGCEQYFTKINQLIGS